MTTDPPAELDLQKLSSLDNSLRSRALVKYHEAAQTSHVQADLSAEEVAQNDTRTACAPDRIGDAE